MSTSTTATEYIATPLSGSLQLSHSAIQDAVSAVCSNSLPLPSNKAVTSPGTGGDKSTAMASESTGVHSPRTLHPSSNTMARAAARTSAVAFTSGTKPVASSIAASNSSMEGAAAEAPLAAAAAAAVSASATADALNSFAWITVYVALAGRTRQATNVPFQAFSGVVPTHRRKDARADCVSPNECQARCNGENPPCHSAPPSLLTTSTNPCNSDTSCGCSASLFMSTPLRLTFECSKPNESAWTTPAVGGVVSTTNPLLLAVALTPAASVTLMWNRYSSPSLRPCVPSVMLLT